jgi:hypothetical protein
LESPVVARGALTDDAPGVFAGHATTKGIPVLAAKRAVSDRGKT